MNLETKLRQYLLELLDQHDIEVSKFSKESELSTIVLLGENQILDSITFVEFILDIEDQYGKSLMDQLMEIYENKKMVTLETVLNELQ